MPVRYNTPNVTEVTQVWTIRAQESTSPIRWNPQNPMTWGWGWPQNDLRRGQNHSHKQFVASKGT